MKVRAWIHVMLRDGILDPQGKTVEESLPSLGFDGVEGVRIGKRIEMVVEGESADAVRAKVEEMTRRFLSNPVIEDATVHVDDGGPAPS